MPGKDLCIITARGGSKRVPRKNVRMFCGLPMIAWPTRAAVASGLFSEVIISTEDQEIATVAMQYGARQPFVRPVELADDFSGTGDVLQHALETLAKSRDLPRYCCCLYGTSVMVTPEILRTARKLAEETECVMGICEYPQPVERRLVKNENGDISYAQIEGARKRTQDCEKSYFDIGLLYYFNIDAFLNAGQKSFIPLRKKGLPISRTFAADIDTEQDLAFAEMLAKYNGLKAE